MQKRFRSYRALALAALLLLGYAWQVEPRLLTVRRLVIGAEKKSGLGFKLLSRLADETSTIGRKAWSQK